MRKLAFEYKMEIQFSNFVENHQFQLRCLLLDNLYQKVLWQNIEIENADWTSQSLDGFKNKVIAGFIKNPHQSFMVHVTGEAEVEYRYKYSQEAHPIYGYETKLTKYDCSMESLWHQEGSFLEKMMILCQNIYYEIYYTPNSTTINTTAIEAFHMKKGVCQDFSHIMLAVVRHHGYLARYVTGMMSGEGATHAWVEVYDGDKWYGFDPTNNRMVNNQYLVVAKGRDYRDCLMENGIFEAKEWVGQNMNVHVEVKNQI